MSVAADSGRGTLVADQIAELLAAEGVEFIVGFPENRLLNAAALVGIRPIIARTERVAVNIADGFARVTGGRRFGACAVQYGPGAEAVFGAVAQAYGDRTPILVLPSEYSRREQAVEPNFRTTDAFRQITGWATAVNDPAQLSETFRRAFAMLRGRPAVGPVLVSLATDLLWEERDEPLAPYTPVPTKLFGPCEADVRDLVDALVSAETPVIVAGQGILYAEAWDELRELAELRGIPVATTLNGKSAFPENHPLALGTMGRSRPATVDEFFERADVILGVGTSFTRSDYLRELPSRARLGQIVDDARDLAKNHDIEFGCVGDARLALQQVLAELRNRRLAEPTRNRSEQRIRELRASFRDDWRERLECDTAPISPYRIVHELNETVDRSRTVVTHDAGNPRDQMLPFYEALVPHGYIGWGKTTQLGTGLGLAMGARLARPDWLAVNLMGDAAFGMVGMDFETAVRCDLPVLTIVMNNGVMGGYGRYMPDAVDRYRSNRVGGDYSVIARSLGGHGERVTHPGDLRPALERAIGSVETGTAALLEVMTREEPEFPLG
ncbi:MAG: thiamine pyrophosphate-requiring protein [Solirubrobacteraceae bacterium]